MVVFKAGNRCMQFYFHEILHFMNVKACLGSGKKDRDRCAWFKGQISGIRHVTLSRYCRSQAKLKEQGSSQCWLPEQQQGSL